MGSCEVERGLGGTCWSCRLRIGGTFPECVGKQRPGNQCYPVKDLVAVLDRSDVLLPPMQRERTPTLPIAAVMADLDEPLPPWLFSDGSSSNRYGPDGLGFHWRFLGRGRGCQRVGEYRSIGSGANRRSRGCARHSLDRRRLNIDEAPSCHSVFSARIAQSARATGGTATPMVPRD